MLVQEQLFEAVLLALEPFAVPFSQGPPFAALFFSLLRASFAEHFLQEQQPFEAMF